MKSDAAPQAIVLAVDDAPETLSLLTDILENAGMTALVARNGVNALSLIGRIAPDLILMDAVMPQMDGFETCRRIKSEGGLPHVPVIFMTGLTDTEHVVKGFEAGGVDYVTKPVEPDELLARIRVHLMNSRLVQSALAALDVSGIPLIAVDSRGGILWMTPESVKLLSGSAKVAPEEEEIWRAEIAPVLAQIHEKKLSKHPLRGTTSQSIFASYIGESRQGEHLIRLREASASSEEDLLRKHFQLTGREAEVLLWITQGKSNRDVAEILGFSPRTVNKHLEQIFHKLSVENRTAAAMLAVRVLTAN
ncbi:response regulator transcription factor [Parvibaculum sp.]|uniref:response regulator transcription factor n=1 Tax=Parvibaculum sp. TaxID=2024848 RepID=UPI002C550A19|nr:response regulator transcription factor [Parvibaculum sp.]HUD53415.1 response regulator transcription factor [Parvibaculum sp.]